ncbi:MAG: hypothetical protein QXK20_02370 [Nitrososphaerales archaeon]
MLEENGGLEYVVSEKVITLCVKSIASHFSLHLACGIAHAVYKFFCSVGLRVCFGKRYIFALTNLMVCQ